MFLVIIPISFFIGAEQVAGATDGSDFLIE